MKSIHIYPAIIERYAEDDYNVKFPDFPEIITCGETLENAFEMAEDALKLCLFEYHQENTVFPLPTTIIKLSREDAQQVALVKVDLAQILSKYDNTAVKKTLTIPSWLNKEAEKEKINFSKILQTALKEHLHIENR